jgi:TonB family protein
MSKFTPNQLLSNRYQLKENIGKGGFADVYRAIDTQANHTQVAIKILAPQSGLASAVRNAYLNEFTNTLNLSHEYLLTPKHYGEFDEICYIIMPLCSAGSLDNCILESNNPNTTHPIAKLMYFGTPEEAKIAEHELSKILFQTASGLDYIHGKGILHNDVKPGNILINDNGDYMLSDFGISSKTRMTAIKNSIDRSALQNEVKKTNSALSIAYSATELFGDYQINTAKTDIFSLGVTIYEVATGNLPWMGRGGVLLNTGASIPNLPKQYSKEFNQIVRSCMDKTPENRPTAKELMKWTGHYLKNEQWAFKERTKIGAVAAAGGGGNSFKKMGGAIAFFAASMLGGGYIVYSASQQPQEGYTEISAAALSNISYNSPNVHAFDNDINALMELNITGDPLIVAATNENKLVKSDLPELPIPAAPPFVAPTQRKEELVIPMLTEIKTVKTEQTTIAESSPKEISTPIITDEILNKSIGKRKEVSTQPAALTVALINESPATKRKETIGTTPVSFFNEANTAPIAEKAVEKNIATDIFVVVDEKPEFVGGEKGLYEWVNNNIEYPSIALKNEIQGKAVVQFVVEPDGNISNVVCLRGPEGGCKAEAKRVVNNMPKWVPGRINNQPVRTRHTLTVQFKIPD